MIVNYTEEGWEIVTQRAHGLLAAAIAEQWNHTQRGPFWLETLIAIAEHDDAHVELQRDDLLTPQGGPVNFTMRKRNLGHCRQTLENSLSKSTYIALLCSMHLDFIFRESAKSDPEVKGFLRMQTGQRKEWREALSLSAAEADKQYRLLEWCDALSLLLCQHDEQPEMRTVEISEGPDKHMYRLKMLPSGTLSVLPWPFEQDQFTLKFESRVLPGLQYSDSAGFRTSLFEAPPRFKTIRFKRSEDE